jgi:hypothetical protein
MEDAEPLLRQGIRHVVLASRNVAQLSHKPEVAVVDSVTFPGRKSQQSSSVCHQSCSSRQKPVLLVRPPEAIEAPGIPRAANGADRQFHDKAFSARRQLLCRKTFQTKNNSEKV